MYTRFYRWRKGQAITASELAVRSGVSKGQISKLENNHHANPSINTIRKIARSTFRHPSDLVREVFD